MARIQEGIFITTGTLLLLACGTILVTFVFLTDVTGKYLDPVLAPLDLKVTHIPFAAVFAVALMVYLSGHLATIAVSFTSGFDNKNPRQSKASLHGLPARLQGAHMNLTEGFAAFVGAVVISTMCNVAPEYRARLSLIYVCARIAYVVMYAINLDIVRSLSSAASNVAVFALFGLSLWPAQTQGLLQTIFDNVLTFAAPVASLIAQ